MSGLAGIREDDVSRKVFVGIGGQGLACEWVKVASVGSN